MQLVKPDRAVRHHRRCKLCMKLLLHDWIRNRSERDAEISGGEMVAQSGMQFFHRAGAVDEQHPNKVFSLVNRVDEAHQCLCFSAKIGKIDEHAFITGTAYSERIAQPLHCQEKFSDDLRSGRGRSVANNKAVVKLGWHGVGLRIHRIAALELRSDGGGGELA